ncbi:Ubiquinone biosynthesis O-methyltransferase, mitochondrial [Methylobacterium crusticola]|uniref:Ubiquinone biosynthesis O-methyltransferase, mitochondrial n=1 Tax=Methylobacterium crusticola TaxID=1697972 RepID=A0ABQ4R6T7_9HYPH|nr:class I SAM-dependent methyltransferase [Methylobacterium crusticola]GJD53423.1 Ubiquinone biosynthesis O-methyltransferase, mitochondrial [Methylobacterium crusticola]
MPSPPLCPVTGAPAVRRVQWVEARLLAALWRIVYRVDARPSFRGVERFGLWESPTGLYFFDPMREGDAGFYAGFYRNRFMRRYLRQSDRDEFRVAAGHVRPGDRVLDVGCGFGAFRHHVPQAEYLGLDPHFAGGEARAWARAEPLGEHLAAHAGRYDVVCAFQVLEHVADPAGLMAEMARAVRPGGKVVVGVPHVPSAQGRIPNWLTNAVPHHLTWWTAPALEALARRAGLVDPAVGASAWSRGDVFVHWMARCSPVRCRDAHYRHAWSWYAAGLLGALGGGLASLVLPLPEPGSDEGVALLMVATRPPLDPAAAGPAA